jgi:hypothetical protein
MSHILCLGEGGRNLLLFMLNPSWDARIRCNVSFLVLLFPNLSPKYSLANITSIKSYMDELLSNHLFPCLEINC